MSYRPKDDYIFYEVFGRQMFRRQDLIDQFIKRSNAMVQDLQENKLPENQLYHLYLISKLYKSYSRSLLSLLPTSESLLSYLPKQMEIIADFIQNDGHKYRSEIVHNAYNEMYLALQWLQLHDQFDFNSLSKIFQFSTQDGGKYQQLFAKMSVKCLTLSQLQQFVFRSIDSLKEQLEDQKSLVTYVIFQTELLKRFAIQTDYKILQLISHSNKQIRQAVINYQAYSINSYESFKESLMLSENVYQSGKESFAFILSHNEESLDWCFELFSLVSLESKVVIVMIYGFVLQNNKYLDQKYMIQVLNFGLYDQSKFSQAYKDSFLFIVYQVSRLKYEYELQQKLAEKVLALTLLSKDNDIRYAAAICFQELDGRVLHKYPIICSQLDSSSLFKINYGYSISTDILRNYHEFQEEFSSYLQNIILQNDFENQLLCLEPLKVIKNINQEEFYQLLDSTEQYEITGVFLLLSTQINEQFDFDQFEGHFRKIIGRGLSRQDLNQLYNQVEALSLLLITYLNHVPESCLMSEIIQFIILNLPFILKHYFIDAKISELRQNQYFNIVTLTSKVASLSTQFKNSTQKDDFLKIILSIEQNIDIKIVTAPYMLPKDTFLRLFILDLIEIKFNEFEDDYLFSVLKLFLIDFANDQRGDIGSHVRFRAYHIFYKLTLKNQAFLPQFIKSSIYFISSKISTFRVYSVEKLLEILYLNNHEILQNIGQLPIFAKQKPHVFDICEPTEIELRRQKHDFFKNLTQNRNVILVHFQHLQKQCILAAIYAIPASIEEETNSINFLQKFDKQDIISTLIELFSRNEPHFYHFKLAAIQFISLSIYKQFNFPLLLIEEIFKFSKTKIPVINLRDCLIIFTAKLSFIQFAFPFLGHSNLKIRERAACFIAGFIAQDAGNGQLLEEFCQADWCGVDLAVLKVERRRFMDQICVV